MRKNFDGNASLLFDALPSFLTSFTTAPRNDVMAYVLYRFPHSSNPSTHRSSITSHIACNRLIRVDAMSLNRINFALGNGHLVITTNELRVLCAQFPSAYFCLWLFFFLPPQEEVQQLLFLPNRPSVNDLVHLSSHSSCVVFFQLSTFKKIQKKKKNLSSLASKKEKREINSFHLIATRLKSFPSLLTGRKIICRFRGGWKKKKKMIGPE